MVDKKWKRIVVKSKMVLGFELVLFLADLQQGTHGFLPDVNESGQIMKANGCEKSFVSKGRALLTSINRLSLSHVTSQLKQDVVTAFNVDGNAVKMMESCEAIFDSPRRIREAQSWCGLKQLFLST